MSALLTELEHQACTLPLEERAHLVEVLLESLQAPPLSDIEIAWHKEIGNRVAAYDRGELQTYSADDVFAEARHIAR